MDHPEGRPLQCGSHHIDAEIFKSASGEITVKCPTCGQVDTLDFARAEASKAELGGAIDHAIKHSSASDVVPPSPQTERPRWILGESGDRP